VPIQERLLRTLVQASDLHFGNLDATTGDSLLSAQAPKLWGLFPWLDGLLGHHRAALEHFQIAFQDLRKGESAELIVTGDITATGNQDQFATASTYLTSRVALGHPLNLVGLSNKKALGLAIPGNHDHWPGTARVVGAPTVGLKGMFPQLPKIEPKRTLPSGCELVLMRIDSDADVGNVSRNRVFARGDFRSQLNQLASTLGAPNHREVRVMLVHHSPMYQSQKRIWKELEVVASSRRALDDFVTDYDIAVILTGHAHVASANIRNVGRSGAKWELLEARCGTTLARDQVPSSWKSASLLKQLPPNTFLVHRLVEVSDTLSKASRIEWRTNLFLRKLRGFEDQGLLPNSGPITVWPRP
jgi:hypothetical protein